MIKRINIYIYTYIHLTNIFEYIYIYVYSKVYDRCVYVYTYIIFYHLRFSDSFLYSYFHNVSANMSSDLLQVFIEIGNLHETSNYVLHWIYEVVCSDSVSYNRVQVIIIPVLLLACTQDWNYNLLRSFRETTPITVTLEVPVV